MSNTVLKQNARSYMLKNAPKLFIVTIIYLAVMTLLPMLSIEISGFRAVLNDVINQIYAGVEKLDSGAIPLDWGRAYSQLRPFGLLLSFVILLFTPVIEFGFLSYSLKISRGQSGDFRSLLDGFSMLGKIIWLSIVQSFFIALWSLLLVVPGIVATYRYSQSYFILLDNPELSAMDCIRESKKLMAGNKLDLFILNLSFLGWLILSAVVEWYIIVPILMIWVQPYITIAQAGFYNYLVRYNPETGDAPTFS